MWNVYQNVDRDNRQAINRTVMQSDRWTNRLTD